MPAVISFKILNDVAPTYNFRFVKFNLDLEMEDPGQCNAREQIGPQLV